MEHRHIVTDASLVTVAAAESVIERGTDSDFVALMKRLRSDPFSESADNALVAAENVESYGNSMIVRKCLEKWRREASHAPR